ncbi:MAG: hypothetical protein AAF108_01920 [Planctomycetota bacterium]
MNPSLMCAFVLVVAGLAAAQRSESVDPTSAWLNSRWQAVMQARAVAAEAEPVVETVDSPTGSLDGRAGLPVYWSVASAPMPREEHGVFRGPVTLIDSRSFGDLPGNPADWLSETPGGDVRDWERWFIRHLETHLDEASRDFGGPLATASGAPMVVLRYDTMAMSWTAATRWHGETAGRWRDAVKEINYPRLDPEFLRLSGVEVIVGEDASGPMSRRPAETWSDIARVGLEEEFFRRTYEGFVRVVVTTSLDLIERQSPDGTLLGVYGQPTAAVTAVSSAAAVSGSVRSHNDSLEWLFAHVDLICPSFDRAPSLNSLAGGASGRIGEGEVRSWYARNLAEANRVRDRFAPEAEVVPFISCHHPSRTRTGMLVDGGRPLRSPEDARAQLDYVAAFGSDGVMLVDSVRASSVYRKDASLARMYEHLTDYWVPHLTRDLSETVVPNRLANFGE